MSHKQIAFPGRTPGQVQIVEILTGNVSIIPAHATALRALTFSRDGELLATASDQVSQPAVLPSRLDMVMVCADHQHEHRAPSFAYTIRPTALGPVSSVVAWTMPQYSIYVLALPGTFWAVRPTRALYTYSTSHILRNRMLLPALLLRPSRAVAQAHRPGVRPRITTGRANGVGSAQCRYCLVSFQTPTLLPRFRSAPVRSLQAVFLCCQIWLHSELPSPRRVSLGGSARIASLWLARVLMLAGRNFRWHRPMTVSGSLHVSDGSDTVATTDLFIIHTRPYCRIPSDGVWGPLFSGVRYAFVVRFDLFVPLGEIGHWSGHHVVMIMQGVQGFVTHMKSLV